MLVVLLCMLLGFCLFFRTFLFALLFFRILLVAGLGLGWCRLWFANIECLRCIYQIVLGRSVVSKL